MLLERVEGVPWAAAAEVEAEVEAGVEAEAEAEAEAEVEGAALLAADPGRGACCAAAAADAAWCHHRRLRSAGARHSIRYPTVGSDPRSSPRWA
jgi:hypothetical protein